MRNRVKYLAILFLAVVGMSSCNPVDEGQLPPSNTNNMTPDQALQLMQGSWYLDRVEYITGPICAGGNNTISRVISTDLNYTGWKIDFTMNLGSSAGSPAVSSTGNYYQAYVGGGNQTNSYCILDDSAELNTVLLQMMQSYPYYMSVAPGDLFIYCGGLWGLQSEGWEQGVVKILNVDANELKLELSFGSGFKKIAYFKRDNQSSIPWNVANLSGNYIHDNTKVVQSGILQYEQIINGGHTLTFTNEIVTENNGERYFKCLEIVVGDSLGLIPIPTFISAYNGVGYSTTSSHLFGSDNEKYAIQSSTNTELILRDYSTCNDYEEYHLTKVN